MPDRSGDPKAPIRTCRSAVVTPPQECGTARCLLSIVGM
jgi:hypothetical protein